MAEAEAKEAGRARRRERLVEADREGGRVARPRTAVRANLGDERRRVAMRLPQAGGGGGR